MMPPITPAEHQNGVDWLLSRQQGVSRIISIAQHRAGLPGLEAMPDDQILALLGVPPARSTGNQAIAVLDDILIRWHELRPDSGAP